MLPSASEPSPCARRGPPWQPFGCDIAAPDKVNREMLPFPFSDGLQLSQSPQPKLPNHAEPCGSIVTPKPPPRSPPPVKGERGVPFLPFAGWPLGLSTTAARLEYGVPCLVLFVTHAYPLSSNARFPGPLIRRSCSSLPESLILTVTVQASGIVTSGGVYKLLSNVNA